MLIFFAILVAIAVGLAHLCLLDNSSYWRHADFGQP